MQLAVCEPLEVGQEPVHPLGTRARVLLTSVFGPYAQDDEYGSRTINPMELHHNQVTRVQGPFSLRMFHRTWGLLFIQANITAPCTCLDFPTMERFIEEIRTHHYDIVGIGSIISNLGKVRKMCELIRKYQPHATIVVGGHIANMPDLAELVDADHIVHGEGVRWFRRFLGEDEDQPIRHPLLWSGSSRRAMGISLPFSVDNTAAALIPSVGCPIGCNFCSTSHMFGGKGHFVNFYETGDELFSIMCQLEESMKVRSFFIMDENFLLHRPRALRLLELMEQHDKSWALYIFSSANALRTYTMKQLVSLGVSWVWIGLEGEASKYAKLAHADTHALVRELHANGIHVLGSTIIGLEEHTPENIDAAIDYAVSHEVEFHQFMLYTPTPGTPLHAEMSRQGVLLSREAFSEADTHGQDRFNYRHAHIPPGQETALLLRAFRKDFETNGPSILRIVATTLAGWRRYKDHPSPRIRDRYRLNLHGYSTAMAGALWAARRWFKDNAVVAHKMDELLEDVYRVCGVTARISAPVLGRVLLVMLKREDKRLRNGWTIEPPTYYDMNDQAIRQGRTVGGNVSRLRSVGVEALARTREPLAVT